MSKTWKWMLGIVLILVMVAAVAFVARSFYVTRAARVDRFENFRPPLADRFDRDNWRGPSSRYDKFYGPRGNFDRRAPMCGGQSFGGYRGWGHPMMGYGYIPFGGLFMGFGMLLMWIVPLGLLFLVIYGAVRLANKPRLPTATQACANCGKATQADWKNCPYCGTTL